jgi:hypothetical protein
MPSSRHQQTLRCLRHRAKESREVAVEAMFAAFRDRLQNRELVQEAMLAVVQHDEACHSLDLAEAKMPKPLKSGE